MPMTRVKLRLIHLASFVIVLAERMLNAFWPVLTWTFFFAGLWLLQIPLTFGFYAAIAAQIIFIAGFLYIFTKNAKNFQWPRHKEIKRRIETDSKVHHRPLSNAGDKIVYTGSLLTYNLWHRNKAYLREALKKLKPAKLQTILANRDPHALRYAALLFFVCGLLVAGQDWNTRLLSGILPFAAPEINKGTSLQLIIKPPDYVSKADLDIKGEDKLKIPVGSTVKAILNGGFIKPILLIDKKKIPFKESENETWIAEAKITEGTNIAVRRMLMTMASWDIEITPDTPPTLKIKSEPLFTTNSQIVIPVQVHDDYGVERLAAEMTLDPAAGKPPLGDPATEERSILSPAGKDFDTSPVYDFTAHPWAGLPVEIKLTAKDHLGQSASAEPIKITLPERSFRHPISNQIITFRKQLITTPEMPTQPMASEIETYLAYPGAFQNDLVTFLAIRTLASRLYWFPPSIENTKQVIGLMWDIAIKIEDGDLPLAERNLRNAQNALDRALQNDATDAEISSLMHELREAMAAYLTEMQRELQKKMAENSQTPSVTLDPDAVQNFLDQMQEALQQGDRKTLQNMLSQLQRMMDMVSPQYAELPKDMQKMQEIANLLQEIIQRQEILLTHTQEKMNTIAPFQLDITKPVDPQVLLQLGLQPPTFVDTKENETEQESIRISLNQVMTSEALGPWGAPDNIKGAEREMQTSSESLSKNDPQTSIPHQEEALRLLKQSQQEAIQQFMQRLQQIGGSFSPNGQGLNYDPLGRPYEAKAGDGGLFPGSDVKLPDEAERQQALEILRELRRRSGQRERPELELDYYRRLLKQF